MRSAPSTITATISDELEVLAVPPSSGHSTPAGQGGGSPPVESGGPAATEADSTHASASAQSGRLIEVSPVLLVNTLSAGFAGRTPHDTPVDPASNALLRTYLTAGLLGQAADLCRERLLSAETEKERHCWVKDLSLVKMAAGDFQAAYDLSLTLRAAATRYAGSFRGRLEVSFARAHANLRQYDPAFERYTAGHYFADSAGDSYLAAQIDTNTGRCYTSAGRPEDSFEYFDRANVYALKSNDILLQAEIDESRALAYEREGDYAKALTCAARSLYLLAPTGYMLAQGESEETYMRIKSRATRAEAKEVFERIEGKVGAPA